MASEKETRLSRDRGVPAVAGPNGNGACTIRRSRTIVTSPRFAGGVRTPPTMEPDSLTDKIKR